MIDVNTVYQKGKFLANDTGNTGKFTVTDWNNVFDLVQKDIIRDLREKFEKNIIISDNIADLKVVKKVQADSEGRVSKPDDYLFFSANRITFWYKDLKGKQQVAVKPVTLLRDDQLGDRLNSLLNPVTTDYPVLVDYGSNLQFFPSSISHVELVYIKLPKSPVWAFTEVNGRPVYDESNSTNFTLPPDMEGDVIGRVLRYLATNTKEANLFQAGQIMEEKQNV